MTTHKARTRGFVASTPKMTPATSLQWSAAVATYRASQAELDARSDAYEAADNAADAAIGDRPAELVGWLPQFPHGLPAPQEWSDLYERQPDEARRLYPIFQAYLAKRRVARAHFGVDVLHGKQWKAAEAFHDARDALIATPAPDYIALAEKVAAYCLGSPDLLNPEHPDERAHALKKGTADQLAIVAIYDAAKDCEPGLALRIAAFARAFTRGVIDPSTPDGIRRATISSDDVQRGLVPLYLDALSLAKKG